MATLDPHALVPARRQAADASARRWRKLAIAAAVFLAVYAGGVAWVATTLEASVDRSLQPLPALVHDQPQP